MRRLSDSILAPIVVIIFNVLVITSGVAGAHATSTFYPRTWAGNESVIQQSTDNLPSGSFNSALNYARGEWNSVPGGAFDMFAGASSGANPVYNACSQPSTNIYAFAWQWDGSGGTLGNTQLCFAGSTVVRGRVFLDTLDGWYLGSGSPGGLYDGRSVLTHELGHAGGFVNHFSDACAGTINTMCPSIGAGQSHWRTLESHDEHTFDAAY